MPFEQGMELVHKAYEMEDEKKMFRRWIAGYDREMSFNEFKNKLGSEKQSYGPHAEKTEKEILNEVKAILEMR